MAVPDPRIDRDQQRHGEHAEREPAEPGPQPLGPREAARTSAATSSHRVREQRSRRPTPRARARRTAAAGRGGTGSAAGCRTAARVPKIGERDRVRDHAREHARDQRLGLEVVAVQHLDREQRGAERRAEHRGDARADAGDHQDAALARRQRQVAPDERADRGADLHRRPLAAAGAAGAERRDRRDRLHPQTRRRITPLSVWNASIAASPPPPRVSGANRVIQPLDEAAERGARAGAATIGTGRSGRCREARRPRAAGRSHTGLRAARAARARARTKTRCRRCPATAPTSAARSNVRPTIWSSSGASRGTSNASTLRMGRSMPTVARHGVGRRRRGGLSTAAL